MRWGFLSSATWHVGRGSSETLGVADLACTRCHTMHGGSLRVGRDAGKPA